MKIIAIFFFQLVIFNAIASSHDYDSLNWKAKNMVTMGISGRGYLYHANGDRIWSFINKIKITSSVGFSYFPNYSSLPGGKNGRAIAIIISPLNLLLGGKNNYFEFDISTTYRDAYFIDPYTSGPILTLEDVKRYKYFSINGFLGWRRQKTDGGFVYRVGYVPDYNKIYNHPVWNHSVEIGVGYSFN